jgi:hypothetical protein
MSAPFLRPRSTGEILDAAFQIVRAHFVAIAIAVSVLMSPLVVMRLLLPLGAGPLLDRLSNLFYMAAGAAVVVMVSEAYLGRVPDRRAAVGEVGRRFFSVWGASIIQGILIVIGLLLLVVPGFIFAAWTFAMIAAVMLEGKRAGEAFTRSRELARGNVGRILITMAVAYVIFFAVVIGMSIVVEYLPIMSVAGERVLTAAMELVAALGYVLIPAVGTVLYYDLRIRNEAFDVEIAAARLDEADVQPIA